jgi:hypothetical protein
MNHNTSLLATILIFSLGCGDDSEAFDAGPGSLDADVQVDGSPDSALPEDADVADGAVTDAAVTDAADAAPMMDSGAMPVPSSCADRSADIAAATGATIDVEPAGPGMVSVGGSTRTLRDVVRGAATGDTILLADGTYTFPEGGDGTFTGLYFTTPGITMRSASGDASRVILDSAYVDHGNSSAAITVAAADTVLADFTVQRSVYHLIHFWADGDGATVHNVTLIDGGQQFVKASPGGDARVDDVEISCSRFLMTDAGRDNVWGYGSSSGNTTCYTGGIDSHDSRDWHVHDNLFNGIYCTADGVMRPLHGVNPETRGGQTYRGGLSEHAIHMWDSESGSGHLIERNQIINCARGIGLGFRVDTYGTTIRNNMIFSEFPGSREHDVGISVERAHNTSVVNNTVFFSSDDAYSSTIEYRYASTTNVDIRNNLTNRRIRARDGAEVELSANVTDARAEWFADASSGNLRLASCGITEVVDAGDDAAATDDFDGAMRVGATDIGADECSE